MHELMYCQYKKEAMDSEFINRILTRLTSNNVKQVSEWASSFSESSNANTKNDEDIHTVSVRDLKLAELKEDVQLDESWNLAEETQDMKESNVALLWKRMDNDSVNKYMAMTMIDFQEHVNPKDLLTAIACLCSDLSLCRQLDPNLSTITMTKESDTILVYMHYKSPSLIVKDRDFVFRIYRPEYTDNAAMFVACSVTDPKYPEQQDKVRGNLKLMAWSIHKPNLDSSTLHIYYVLHSDPNGLIPKFLVNHVLYKRMNILSQCKSMLL